MIMNQKISVLSRTIIALAVMFGTLASNGCKYDPAAPNNNQTAIQRVRFGSFSSAVDYGPYIVAKNKGWFDESLKSKNIKTEYVQFQSLPPINESFATDRVDVVFEAEPPAIVGRAAGIDVDIIGISCTLVQEILVPAKSSVNSIADLKGKKIAVLGGTSSHYGLLKILSDAGLKNSDIEVVDMIPPDAKNAFQTGRVDAWAVWPPWIEQEEIAGTGRVLPRGSAAIHSIMAVRGSFAKQNPEITRELVAVLNRSKQWITENPVEAQEIIARELNVSVEVVKRSWDRHDWKAQINDDIISDIQAKSDFLTSNGFIRTSVNVRNDMIDLSYSK